MQLRITGLNGFAIVRDMKTYRYLIINERTGRTVGWAVNYSQALLILNEIAYR